MSDPGLLPSRRKALALGWGGFAGLAMRHHSLLPLLDAEPRTPGKARACIVLWMEGGPSQIDTFDPKPGRATGGEFGAIGTRVPGMDLSDRLPRIATLADSFSLIRSMTSTQLEHGPGSYLLRTGYGPKEGRTHPSLGSVISQELAPGSSLGIYVRIRAGSQPSGFSQEGSGSGFLGQTYQPFEIDDPLHPRQGFPTLSPALARRSALAIELDRGFAKEHVVGSIEARAAQRSAAVKLEGSALLEALSLEGEGGETRASYGADLGDEGGAFGTGCLLARRLVERGSRFVEVTLSGWDTHTDNFRSLAPILSTLDLGMSGLLRDLKGSGLLSSTLVLWMGEFGRTPAINAQRGRDHYGKGFSVALAGGGIQGGRIVGSTGPLGLEIVKDPVTVPDLFATIHTALGSDPARKQLDAEGELVRLTNHGTAVKALFE